MSAPAGRLALVVDDDELSVRAVSTVLRHAGWRVVGMTDPRETLAACRAQAPAVVLLDFMMPHLDGRELVELLRRELGAQTPGLVLVSGSEDREAVAHALRIPSVAKPYLPGELLDAIAQALGEPEHPLIPGSLPLKVDSPRD